MFDIENGYHGYPEYMMAENNLMSWQGETLEFVSKRIAGILLETRSVSIATPTYNFKPIKCK